jgi:Asp-tRNA(Asn)/Glu-tRNA(Gln) amidotransferase B subunit
MNEEYYKLLSKIVIQIINPALKESEQREFYLACSYFHDLDSFTHDAISKAYPWGYLKKIVDLHVDLNQFYPCISYTDLVSLYPYESISDDGALNTICDKILAANPKSIEDYKKGKMNSLNHLKGQVMKETKGKANIQKVEIILKEKMI